MEENEKVCSICGSVDIVFTLKLNGQLQGFPSLPESGNPNLPDANYELTLYVCRTHFNLAYMGLGIHLLPGHRDNHEALLPLQIRIMPTLSLYSMDAKAIS